MSEEALTSRAPTSGRKKAHHFAKTPAAAEIARTLYPVAQAGHT